MTKGKMTYLGGGQPVAAGARKYEGTVATGYDAKRDQSPKWKAEQAMLEEIIAEMPEGTKVLDVPVGTGRLIPAFRRSVIRWTGVDVSQDMLNEAAKQVGDQPNGRLMIGNVLALPFGDDDFHTSFCIRITRWLSDSERRQALAELCRVTKTSIWFTARTAGHPLCYPLAQIHADIPAGWDLATVHQIGDDQYYSLIELRRV